MADTVVYAFVLDWPKDGYLNIAVTKPTDQTYVRLLGYNGTLPFKALKPSGMTIDFTSVKWTSLPNLWAWTLRFENLETDSRVPYMEEPRIPPGPRNIR